MQSETKSEVLSHIILYVDENIPKDCICAIRTNILGENPGIRFTYISYDNQNADMEIPLSQPGLILLSDHPKTAAMAADQNIPVAGIEFGNDGRFFDRVKYVITNPSDISLSDLVKIYDRCKGIPWEIARTKRLIIRELSEADADRLYEIYKNPEITKYTEGLYDDIEKERAYMRDYIKYQYGFYEYGVWGLFLKDNGKLIGRAGLSLRDGFLDPELGYVIAKEYQNKGMAKEACDFILNYAKEELLLKKVNAFTHPDNKYSIMLLEGLGFKREEKYEINGVTHTRYAIML